MVGACCHLKCCFFFIFISLNILIGGCVLCSKSLQLCLTLCDPMDCSLQGSSVPEISQTRRLEWVARFFSGSPWPRDRTWVSCIAGRFWVTRYIFLFSQLVLKCLKLRGFPLCILKDSSFLSHRKVLNVKVESFSLRGPAIMSPSLGVLNQCPGALGKWGWFWT